MRAVRVVHMFDSCDVRWPSLLAGGLAVEAAVLPGRHVRAASEHERAVGEALSATAPGPELAAALAALEWGGLDGHGLVEAAAGWQRLISWAQAEQAAVLAELTGRDELRPAESGSGFASVGPVTSTAVEVAGRLCLTVRQAEGLVGQSGELVEGFPATHAALRAGLIDARRARVITAELAGRDVEVRQRVEAAALDRAAGLDSVGLRRRVRRLVSVADPADAAARAERARAGRYVAVTPVEDGMAWLEALLPAEDAQAVATVLDAAAEAGKRGDREAARPARTVSQRRADALAQLAWAALAAGREGAGPGTAPGRPVTVQVTVPLTTLAGLDEQPGELDGHGPIPAPVARRLAAAGVWEWLGTHPTTGQVMERGLARYRPTRALADFITSRDRTCRAPGYHRPAWRCDIDHRRPHAQGGATSAENCLALCRTHHLLKHHTRWTVDNHPGGGHVWTSPTGHRYLKPPEPVGPTADELNITPLKRSTEPSRYRSPSPDRPPDRSPEAADPDDIAPF